MNTHVLLLGALVGVLTTATSDVGIVLGSRLGVGGPGPRRSGPDIIGRWFAYMFRGRFSHNTILDSAHLPGELPTGLVAHYLIGIIFTFAFGLIMLGLQVKSMVLPAMLFGLVTVVFPWFLMLPSQGFGFLGRGVPAPAQMTRASLFSHLMFGLSLALWVTLLRPF